MEKAVFLHLEINLGKHVKAGNKHLVFKKEWYFPLPSKEELEQVFPYLGEFNLDGAKRKVTNFCFPKRIWPLFSKAEWSKL